MAKIFNRMFEKYGITQPKKEKSYHRSYYYC